MIEISNEMKISIVTHLPSTEGFGNDSILSYSTKINNTPSPAQLTLTHLSQRERQVPCDFQRRIDLAPPLGELSAEQTERANTGKRGQIKTKENGLSRKKEEGNFRLEITFFFCDFIILRSR